METLGLNHEGLREYHQTLRSSHDIRVEVTLMNLDHEIVGTARVLDGQVQGDRFGFGDRFGPQRRVTLTALDPHNTLAVGDSDPDEEQLYYDRIVQVTYSVLCPTLGWVECEVFTGIPWKLQRTNDEVYIEADDLSVLGWEAVWKPLTIAKGIKKTTAIRRILARSGFTRVRLPERTRKLSKPVSLNRRQHPWAGGARIATSMDLQPYVDGAGIPTARRLPQHALWTFDTEIVEPIAVSTDKERFANVVEVIGRRPKGAKRRVRWVAPAPAWHDLSAKNLRHNGQPYRVVETIRNDHFRTTAECRRKAERVLADRLRARDELTVGILPWPHVTPGDMARFVTADGEPTKDRIDTFTLPLGVGEPMRIGWHAKDTQEKRQVRR